MQNEIAPAHGGIVTAVRVKPGDTVDAGEPLVSLRPPEPAPAPAPAPAGTPDAAGDPARAARKEPKP
jgi:pyruvate dehydrogenase E2 component (dihydrolipoamide acetyltransferase)